MIVSRELYTEVRFRHVWWCPHCMKVLNKGNKLESGELRKLCKTGLMI